MQIVTEKLTYW